MQRYLLAGLTLALCAPAFAQTKSFTSPKGYVKTEGPNYGYFLGSYPTQTHQLIEGGQVGGAKVITALQMRRDSLLSALSTRNGGRSFTNLTISMAETDIDKVTTSFAANMGSSPSVVFSAAYSVPTVTGFPTIKNPAVWGGLKGEFNFTFSKIYLYPGKKELITEWKYSGGKLHNGLTWATNRAYYYYMDSVYTNTQYSQVTALRVPATLNTCNDSSITYTTGAYTYGYGYVYGKNASIVNYRDKVFIQSYSYYVAAGKPVVHAFGLQVKNGVNAGAKCNKLYVNAAAPMVLVPFMTISGLAYGYSGTYYHIFKWNKILANLPFALQGAWSDSKTGQFALTAGMMMQFPGAPPPDKIQRKSVYESSGGRYRYVSPTDGYITPLQRFVHK